MLKQPFQMTFKSIINLNKPLKMIDKGLTEVKTMF